MVEPIAPAEPSRSVDRVAAALRTDLLGGRYPSGGYLPPERELATTLGVNRLTLRAALARLQSEGLVQPKHGAGVRVVPLREGATLEVLPHLVATRDRALVASFLELRRALATEALALACVRATDAQLDALEALAGAQRAARDPQRFAAGDLAFGRAVLVAAGSVAFELLLNSVEKAWHAAPWLHAALHEDRDAVVASYDAVIALLRARDPDTARALVRPALEAIDAAALARLAADEEGSAP